MSRATNFYRDSVLPHVAGGALGGLATGLLAAAAAALAGLAPSWLAAGTVAALLAVVAIGEIVPVRVPRPSAMRQVPRDFQRTHYHRTTAFLWGLDLGFGWSTKQPTPAFLMTVLAAVVAGPEVALAAGIVFGVLRSATLVMAAGSADREVVEARFQWFARHPGVARGGTTLSGLVLVTGVTLSLI